jgi:hypothetical protein
MLSKRPSRRAFLQAAGIPMASGLSGLPLLASPRPLWSSHGGGMPAGGEDSLPIEVENGASPSIRVKEAVLYPFDDHSIPFTWNLRLQLIMGKKMGRPAPIVLAAGKDGEPDNLHARYYGTVIQVGDELRMWYMGSGDKLNLKGGKFLSMYAVSNDGIKWEKPKLGLIEYNGSKQNNIVDLMRGQYGISEHVVIYEPDDPDPSRRFKMVFESSKYQNRLAVAFSADGLRWTESTLNPLASGLEESGLIKYNGCYYVNGQGGGQYGSGRQMTTFASYDFEHWTTATALSFKRAPQVELDPDKVNTVEEVHLGASLIVRGNVILGVYGMWHGVPSGDRSYITMDLGLIVSNDGLHFREPIQDFHFVPCFEELDVPLGRGPSVAQGQGMVSIGDKTLYWYEAWGTGGVRLATWERDRLGYFRPFPSPATNPYSRSLPASLISCPMKLAREGGRIFINADGLSDLAELKVELQDREFKPIPGYSGEDCVPIRTSGFRQAVTWRGKDKLEAFPHPIRVRVAFGGERWEDSKLYAIYVTM